MMTFAQLFPNRYESVKKRFAILFAEIELNVPMYISGFIQQRPVLTFYVLTFAISWGGVLIVVGPGGFPLNPAQIGKMLPLLILAMLAGPSVACILLTGVVSGRAGYRDLLSRLLKWRVGIGWYATALLGAPFLMTVLFLTLSLRFPEFIPRIFMESNKGPILAMGLAVGLVAGIFEELGWTGFVIPKLRLRFDALNTGLIVGFLWGAWHLLVNFLSSGTPSGKLSVPSLLGSVIFSVGTLPSFRVLMVWMWDHTNSVLVAMLMHFSLTASSILFGPSAAPGMMGIAWNLVLAAALWVVVAACVATSGRYRRVHSVHA